MKDKKSRKKNRNDVHLPLHSTETSAKNSPASLPLLNKLNTTEYAWAASAISQLVLEPESKHELLLHSSTLVAKLLSLVNVDENWESLAEVLGALVNLSGADDVFCHNLVSENGIQTLSVLLVKAKEVAGTSIPDDLNEKEKTPLLVKKSFSTKLMEAILSIYWHVAEASESAVTALSTQDSIVFLLGLLSSSSYPDLAYITGQLLYTISEDNLSAAQILMAQNAHAIFSSHLAADSSAHISPSLRILSACALYNMRQAIDISAFYSPMLQLIRGVLETTDISVKAKENDSIELAVELLTNLLSVDDDGQEWADTDMDADENEDDDMIEYNENMEQHVEETVAFMKDPASVQIAQPIFYQLCQLVTLSVEPEKFTSRIKRIKSHCANCISNMFINSIGTDSIISNTDQLSSLWAYFMQTATSIPGSTTALEDIDLIESVLNAALSLCQTLQKFQPQKEILQGFVSQMNEADVEWFFNAVKGTSGYPDSIKLRLIAILSLFAQCPNQVQVNKRVGDFFLHILESSTAPTSPISIDTITEILNAVFDIYADANFDYDTPVFFQGNYLQRLRSLMPLLKSRSKSVDKRVFPSVRGRIDEALVNLRLFCGYKEKEYRHRPISPMN